MPDLHAPFPDITADEWDMRRDRAAVFRIVERTAMYQMTALNTGRPLRRLLEAGRRNWHGPWGDKIDARLHLDAWRRVLDREEPDYRL